MPPARSYHQAARDRSISPPRSPNIGIATLQTRNPLPRTPLHSRGNHGQSAEQFVDNHVESNRWLDEPNPTPRVHRQRTPPPFNLKDAYQSHPTPARAASRAQSDFAIDGSPPPHAFHVELVSPSVPSRNSSTPSPIPPLEQPPQRSQIPVAPTLAEFKEWRAREIRELQNVKKFDPPASWKKADEGDAHMSVKEQREREGRGKGGIRKIWTYSHSEQSIMSLIRADVQHSYLDLGPFNNYLDDQRFQRALEFVKTIPAYAHDVDTAADDDFYCTTEVSIHFKVTEGGSQKVEWLLEGDRCLYPEGNLAPENFMKTDIALSILVRMYFGTSRGLAYLFLERQLKPDDPKILEELLEFVTEQNLDDLAQAEPLHIVDRSPEASYGPSLAAIAFVAINIRHALERLKAPPKPANKKGRKNGKNNGKRTKELAEPVRTVVFTEAAYGACQSSLDDSDIVKSMGRDAQ
ncbi:hypothetical protein FRC09_014835 [Ceratobasidium sp. 395]|nr:hypothetical protein FRC09_014835 [Ceratobasidium sp. 395]